MLEYWQHPAELQLKALMNFDLAVAATVGGGCWRWAVVTAAMPRWLALGGGDGSGRWSARPMKVRSGRRQQRCGWEREALKMKKMLRMMATNYMGAFFLTKHLLPLLRNSPVPSRVVNVTSFTHRSVHGTKFDKESVTGKSSFRMEQYPCSRIYAYSKLCLLLFSYELHRRLRSESSSHVSIVAVDPGVVKTSIMREVPPYLSYTAFAVLTAMGLLDSPECAVNSILDAALAPPEISGVYFFGGNGRTINSSSLSYDAKLARELWATSCNLFLEAQLSDKNISSSVQR